MEELSAGNVINYPEQIILKRHITVTSVGRIFVKGLIHLQFSIFIASVHMDERGLQKKYSPKRVPSCTATQLAEYFHLPLDEAAKKLGVCTNVVKRMCREAGTQPGHCKVSESVRDKTMAVP